MYEDVLRQSRRMPDWAVLVVTGSDARTFLQGQISTDLQALETDRVLLTTINSPQGRVQDLVWIAPRREALLLITRTEVVDATLARLKKYVLRAKVQIERSHLSVAGVLRGERTARWTAPLSQSQQAHYNIIQWPGDRLLLVGELDAPLADAAFTESWTRADMASGIPTIHVQTRELFVAQMLNADLLGGISFEKGCYTGQEIIARTHFRGTVKRRMFRYSADCTAPAPGTRITANGDAAGEVVTAVATASGCEFLAVVQLGQVEKELTLDGQAGVKLVRLELPYEVAPSESLLPQG